MSSVQQMPHHSSLPSSPGPRMPKPTDAGDESYSLQNQPLMSWGCHSSNKRMYCLPSVSHTRKKVW